MTAERRLCKRDNLQYTQLICRLYSLDFGVFQNAWNTFKTTSYLIIQNFQNNQNSFSFILSMGGSYYSSTFIIVKYDMQRNYF